MSLSVLGLSFLAGLLTCLSPCVFPVIPLIVGSSLQRSRFGPLAVGIGMVVSFTAVGVLLMSTNFAASVSPKTLRTVASVLLIAAGISLVSEAVQRRLSTLLTPIAAKSDRALQSTEDAGLFGQFATGCLLGVVWSPCTGPTMGATLAIGLQSGASLGIVLSMVLFGVGAATPLLAFAYGARGFLSSRRNGMFVAASTGKKIFGVFVILVGSLLLTGYDKVLEEFVLNMLPDWLIQLSVKF